MIEGAAAATAKVFSGETVRRRAAPSGPGIGGCRDPNLPDVAVLAAPVLPIVGKVMGRGTFIDRGNKAAAFIAEFGTLGIEALEFVPDGCAFRERR